MKTIRLFHRLMNYTSKPQDRVKCEHSLAHSLRISPPTAAKKTKAFEWNSELVSNNLVWAGSDIEPLENIAKDSRLEWLYQLAPEPKIHNQSKLQTQLRQYRRKLKKAITSETQKGNLEAATLMDKILNSTDFVPYESIQLLGQLPLQRKQQRLKMLQTYLNAHNQLRDRPNANSVFLQEGIFKVPHQWKVGTDIISLEDYLVFTRQFLEHYFPDYPVKLIIGHDDERHKEDKTGAHTHYFISGQNQKTGEYDLRKAQIKVVNEYIRQHAPEENKLSEDGRLTRVEAITFGHYYQCMVLDFANANLFKNRRLKAEFAPESEQKSAQRKKMNAEVKLPKSEHSHNYYMYQLERMMQEMQVYEARNAQLVAETNGLERNKTRLLADISQKQIIVNDLIDKEESFKSEVNLLQDEISHLKQLMEDLKNTVESKLVDVFKNILLATLSRDQKMATKQAKYLALAFNQALELPPFLAQGIHKEISTLDNNIPSIDAEDAMDK